MWLEIVIIREAFPLNPLIVDRHSIEGKHRDICPYSGGRRLIVHYQIMLINWIFAVHGRRINFPRFFTLLFVRRNARSLRLGGSFFFLAVFVIQRFVRYTVVIFFIGRATATIGLERAVVGIIEVVNWGSFRRLVKGEGYLVLFVASRAFWRSGKIKGEWLAFWWNWRRVGICRLSWEIVEFLDKL